LPYGVGWTLNYEAYFYLVFGASLLFKSWRWAALFSWLVLTLVGIPPLVGEVPHLDPRRGYGMGNLDFLVNPIVWDFAAGVVIALIAPLIRLPGPKLL
jgi:peptidoglycan/LPS O-acetylase OafA/YrhL